MRPDALAPYETALRANHGDLGLVGRGCQLSLDVTKWLGPVDDADRDVLSRCVGPVLDVGCGPGRFVRALGELGLPALGLDIATAAVQLTRGLGMPALERDIFSTVPGEGRWHTALLMDGNIGIGGDVARLLERLLHVLHTQGRLIVEVDDDPELDESLWVRFTIDDRASGPEFPWARIGRRPLLRSATEVGFVAEEVFYAGGRCFVCLRARAVEIR